jgi:hypothetical protein
MVIEALITVPREQRAGMAGDGVQESHRMPRLFGV